MRIALFTDLYAPYVGGQPIRFEELASRLAARGHTVSVHAVRTHGVSPEEADEGGVRVVRWPLDERYDEPRVAATKRGVASTVRFALRVRRVLRTEAIDFAYFNQWPFLHVIAAPRKARRRAGIDWCELRSGAVYGAIQRRLPKLVRINCCVNDLLAERLAALSGAAVSYLPSGVTTERYWTAPEQDRRGLVFLGRFVDTKDLPLAVAAYGELRRRGFDEPFVLVGDGSERSHVEAAIAALPAEYRGGVQVLGRVDEDAKTRALATSRVLVLSSRREGFPVVVAEAMASGLPVATVTRPDNGTSHVVKRFAIGESGEPTPAGLADAIEQVIARWSYFSDNGLKAVADLHWERVVDRFLELAATVAPPTSS